MALWPALVDVLQALDFEPKERAEHDRKKIVQPARRHGQPDGDGDREVGGADEREQERRAEPELLQEREHDRADDHEGGVEHVDRGHDAGAAIGAGPDLHRGKDRNDEKPAGDRQPGEIDGDMDAVRRGKIAGDGQRSCRRHDGGGGPAEVEREQAEQHRGDHRRQQHDAPRGEPGGKTGAETD